MKKVAILIDAGFLQKSLFMGSEGKDAKVILDYCSKLINNKEEEIFRIYYYDCRPFDKKKPLPVTGQEKDFSSSDMSKGRNSFLDKMAKTALVAFRQGELKFRGWKLRDKKDKQGKVIGTVIEDIHKRWEEDSTKSTKNINDYIKDEDFVPNFEQKKVDVMIGLDVAWLASKKIVDRLILVSGDTDFVPVLKFARKEGIQVYIGSKKDKRIQDELLKHSDGIRNG